MPVPDASTSAFWSLDNDAAIILTIVLVSGLLSFWQERGAVDAVDKLPAMERR